MAGGGGSTYSSVEIFTINTQAVNHITVSISAGLVIGGNLSGKKTAKPAISGSMSIDGSVGYEVFENSARIEKKTYLYKVYDESNNFVGVWDDVISEPNWSQELNSAGSTTTVKLARNSDSSVIDLPRLEDSSSGFVLDTYSDYIYTVNKSPQKIGPGSNVNHNYRVDIWVFYGANPHDLLSVGAPNGKLKFSGFISEINSKYGDEENTEVQLTSYGYDLDQYPVTSGKLIDNGHFNVNTGGWTGFNTTIARDTTTYHSGVASLKVTFGSQSNRVVYITTPAWLSAGSTVLVTGWAKSVNATAAVGVNQGGTSTETPATVAINNSTWTYFEITVAAGSAPSGNLDFYCNGSDFYLDDVQAYAITPASNSSTTVAFNSYDPSRIIIEGMDQFNLNSGAPTFTTYSNASISPTNTVVSYTFKANTYKELLDKVVQLAPSGWYYYVDLATNEVHFHKISTTAHHTFYLGKHIKTLDVKSYIGDVVNDVLFTGGGEPALYKRYTQTPVAGTRRGLQKMSDNRVTLASSADLLANGEIDEKKSIQYRSTVEILDKAYDIENIAIGQVVAFRNFGNYVDNLKMQIVGLSYAPDSVVLQLDTVPPSVPKRLEDLKRALNNQETDAVPTTPS